MGDVQKSLVRFPSTSDGEDRKVSTDLPGSALSLTNVKNSVFEDENDDKTSTRTRRGRSSNFRMDLTSGKMSATDSDAKSVSPSGPAAYLNSVRSNLTSDAVSSPMLDKGSAGTSSHNSNGSSSGYKLSQKRRNRFQESGNHHKPAEIFRKDLISAMKIPDTSQLLSEEYWVMRDPWRMEWEKGVQVPVNPTGLPATKVDALPKEMKGDFRMPRKMIKTTPDIGDRDAVNLNVLADSTCRYDLDEVDVAWLKVANDERTWMGYLFLDEFTMEIIMEELETQCHESMQLAIKTKVGLGIEYDENIVCDVCKSPDCEEGNEMVFCDGCNLCVHQACYGILKVPDGSWLCKPCAVGIRGSAVCILCGKKGGAMKSTKSGRKWAHMSCALWIPEINIADPERMEPITKISHIPSSRWSLLCTVCKERSVGACIQCSVKHCVTAYHVTCAMESGFDMITDCCSPNSAPNAGESAIIFRSYCQKHSKNYKKRFENSPGKKTEEEKRSDRQKRIAELEEDFYALVKCEGVANALNIPVDTVTLVTEYWKLKRKANFNRPLVTPKQEEGKALAEAAETGLQRRLRMFTHLRQDLERVRNLCYMIGKREKIKRSGVKIVTSLFLTKCHYLEFRMSNDASFDPNVLLRDLPLCGLPELLERAKQESRELAKTKEWSRGNSPDASTSETGTTEQESRIQTPQTCYEADVTMEEQEISQESDKRRHKSAGRKNGLIVDTSTSQPQHRRPQKISKPESKSTVISQSKRMYSEESLRGCENSEQLTLKKTSDLKKLQHSKGYKDLDIGVAEETRDFKTLNRKRSSMSAKTERRSSKVQEVAMSDGDHDTVKRKAKGRLKRHAHNLSDASSQRDSVETCHKSDECPAIEESNKRGDGASSFKRQKKSCKEESAITRTRMPSISDEGKKDRSLASPRHLSHSDKSDTGAQQLHETKMTISTETISETRRLGTKRSDDETSKRSLSKNTDKSSSMEKAKKAKLGNDRIIDESRLRRKPPRPRHLTNSADGDAFSAKWLGGGKPKDKERKKSTDFQEPSLSETVKTNDSKQRQGAKNGQGALASSGGLKGRVEHGRTGDVEAGGRNRPSGQELADQKRSETSPKPERNMSSSSVRRSPRHRFSPSLTTCKSPIIDMDEPNPAFLAAGLGIGYGSGAPATLRPIGQKKSSPKAGPSGLKWLTLVDGDEDNGTVDEGLSYPPCVATPKDQEGYRGDMDESDSDFRGSSSHLKHHQRKSSLRKRSSFNRTGIGVYVPKSPDSSDDDFDIPFAKNTNSTEKVPRQKLRPIIGNIAELESPTSRVSSVDDAPETSKEKMLSFPDRRFKNATESKNVKAVGGILGVPKSEHDADATPFFSRTTDGNNNLQNNFFDRAKQMTPFINNPLQDEHQAFMQDTFVNPQVLDFHQGNVPLCGRMNIFPFASYTPWQMSHNTSLSSFVPPVPYFYRYPPPLQTGGVFDRNMHSPPPMPDSTLSPESFVPTSTSVAVQASSDPPASAQNKKEKPVPDTLSNSFEADAGNEWEIVREDDHRHDDESLERQHRHKHKKRKKKKRKKRQRMLFPEGYESEKVYLSSPSTLSGPMYGAIVPFGQSTQYDTQNSSPHTSVSEHASVRIESDNDRKSTDSCRKIVLKINKKDLIEEKPRENFFSHKVDADDNFGPDSPWKTGTSGLKLTFKRDFGHLVKKYKQRKKLKDSRHRFSSYTISSSSSGSRVFPAKTEKEISRPGMLKRLGLDLKNLPDTDTKDGVGKRTLRERKPVVKKEVSEQANSGKHMPKSVGRSSSLNVLPLRKNQKLKVRVDDLSSSSCLVVKRGRGRPRKIKSRYDSGLSVNPGSVSGPSNPEERKTLAQSAARSLQTSVNSAVKPVQMLPRTASTGSASGLSFQPVSAASFLHRDGGSVAKRSFSTDSDLNPFHGSLTHSHQPARHWKKRKVHEHETQVSEHPNNAAQSPIQKMPIISPPVSRNNDKVKNSPRTRSDNHSGLEQVLPISRATSQDQDKPAVIDSSNSTVNLLPEQTSPEFSREEKRLLLEPNVGARQLSKKESMPLFMGEKLADTTKPSPTMVLDGGDT